MGALHLYAGVVIVSLWACVGVQGHGRLIEPPSRSTAWRYGFNTPHNYNDHEIYCGGYSRQWNTNKGKCGPCGDPWDAEQPRENEEGGKYGLGVIVKKYKHSSIATFGVELTANHRGYFEFRICPHNRPTVPVTNECLDQNVLKLSDGSGTRYYPGPGSKKFYVKYRLPIGMTCKQCVLQWRYVAGNNWGTCENGTGMVGCGPQEQFRSCADITITEEDGYADDTPSFVPPEYEDTNDVDYNEVDSNGWEKSPTVHTGEHVNHVGHVVALTFAFLLILLVIFGLIAYFYWAKDAFKSFMKNRRTSRWMKTAPPAPISPTHKSAVLTISAPIQGPIGAPVYEPPPIPPRRHRSSSGDSETGSHQREIRTISNPTGVTINGIAVKPERELHETKGSHATLHFPTE
ncbi:hypothetical protein SK128_018800 [Halocaridina rubra]|uniref:Chitin-binding type-4 domain-containing protein n=1 Tax=Halocaridina rubra TaxID=373956 RepID=A0AAN8WY72_HALRR